MCGKAISCGSSCPGGRSYVQWKKRNTYMTSGIFLFRRAGLPALFYILVGALYLAALSPEHPPVRPADAASPVLIWDIDPAKASALPRNFRTTEDFPKNETGEPFENVGLKELRASGSG